MCKMGVFIQRSDFINERYHMVVKYGLNTWLLVYHLIRNSICALIIRNVLCESGYTNYI